MIMKSKNTSMIHPNVNILGIRLLTKRSQTKSIS